MLTRPLPKFHCTKVEIKLKIHANNTNKQEVQRECIYLEKTRGKDNLKNDEYLLIAGLCAGFVQEGGVQNDLCYVR
jgi:hypothetical protein